MVKIKAVGVLDCQRYITDKFGAAAHEKIKAAMREVDRDLVYSGEFSSLAWIDLEAVVNHLIAFDQVLGSGDGKTGDAMLRELARKQFQGIYRTFVRATTPKELVAKTANIWARFYDQGDVVTEFVDDHNAFIKVLNCPDMPLHHELLSIPYMEEVLALAGVSSIRVTHPRCVASGAECCVFRYSWK